MTKTPSSPESCTSHLNRGWVYHDRIAGPEAGRSVLDFYTRRYTHSNRAQWRARIESGAIRLDERRTHCDAKLQKGRVLSYHRPPWREPASPRSFTLVCEDEDLVVVSKPAGLQVMPGGDFLENTLLWLLRTRFGDGVAPVHRIGRGTSGLVLFARTALSKRELALDFRLGRLQKTYRALVRGHPSRDEFSVDVAIGPVRYAPLGEVFAARAEGKESLTQVRVMELRHEGGKRTALVELAIPTGRPHQIRIHMAAAGFPLVGETFFGPGGLPREPGAGKRPPLPGDGGYHLHAMKLGFPHPRDGSRKAVYSAPPGILTPASSSTPAV